jgi:hypothetical protein
LDINELTGKVIGCAIEVHRTLGPGLLEADKCSPWYKGGQIAGDAWWLAMSAGATAENPGLYRTSSDLINEGTKWFRSNVFRWGISSWKGGSGFHVHLPPVMKCNAPGCQDINLKKLVCVIASFFGIYIHFVAYFAIIFSRYTSTGWR